VPSVKHYFYELLNAGIDTACIVLLESHVDRLQRSLESLGSLLQHRTWADWSTQKARIFPFCPGSGTSNFERKLQHLHHHLAEYDARIATYLAVSIGNFDQQRVGSHYICHGQLYRVNNICCINVLWRILFENSMNDKIQKHSGLRWSPTSSSCRLGSPLGLAEDFNMYLV